MTLTATVQAGSAAVSPGTVVFCDANAKFCTDIHVVGTAQLASAGTATIRFRPGIGSHSYKAVFQGTTAYSGSSSAASAIAVTGAAAATTTGLTTSGSGGSYQLTATVSSSSANQTPPSGTVSFIDTSNANSVLATSSLAGGTGGLGVLNNFQTSGLSAPVAMVIADFNGDGIPDMAVATEFENVNILLGKGDGTFTAAPSLTTGSLVGGPSPSGLVSGDFNNDGIPDLAIPCSDGETGSLLVYLGNGDGTFSVVGVSPTIGTEFFSIVTADFNEDGNLDLAVDSENNDDVTILLGNGDGTFTPAPTIPAAGAKGAPFTAVADFNGDGIPDLVVLYSDSFAIFLGNGDGTFQKAVPTSLPLTGGPVFTVDFNGDGIPDLVILGYYAIDVFIGKGDGTFTENQTQLGVYGLSTIAVGDFNGDGIPDVVGAIPVSDPGFTGRMSLEFFSGNGDGTLAPDYDVTIGSSIYEGILFAVGDFNGDGVSDIATSGPLQSNQGGESQIILLEEAASATASASVAINSGSHVIEASYSGDTNYAPSSGTATIAYQVPTALTLTTSAAQGAAAGQPQTFTATLTPYSVGGQSTDGESISFYLGSTLLGKAPLTGGVATFSVPSVSPGSQVLSATYHGDSNFATSTNQIVIEFIQDPTSISLSASPTPGVSGAPVTLTAALSGYGNTTVDGETVTFFSNSIGIGTGTLASGKARLTVSNLALGLDSISARYPGDANNNASTGTMLYVVRSANQSTSAVSLAVTSAGAPVTSVPSGTLVTLTATVTGSSQPATGTILFCDLSQSALCSVISNIGTAQLTPTGTASIVTRSGIIGSHSLIAIYEGSSSYASASSSAAPLAITGKYATTTVLQASEPVPGNQDEWGFGATLTSIAPGPILPTGTVQFIDQSSNAALLTTSLTEQIYRSALFSAAPSYPTTSTNPFSVASGDVNHDGIPDLVVANTGNNTIGVFLGKGDGTFSAQATYPAGNGAFAVALGDFNGDGKVDVAVTNFSANTVSILLGNGDGTFQTQQSFATGGGPDAVAVADLNGDGILDLAITNQTDNTVSVLLGNGDGTFKSPQTFNTGTGPSAIVIADFNGDNALDLAVANTTDATLSILLGNGDGTFQTQSTVATGNGPFSIAVADFNGDNFADLVVANLNDNTVSILLGNGNGTFAAQTTYPTGSSPQSVIAGSFGGSKNVDFAVVNSQSTNVQLFVNDGTGKFVHQITLPGGSGPIAAVSGDWNGDGLADIAVLDNTSATIEVVLNVSGPMAIAGGDLILPGDYSFVATYSGLSHLDNQG